VIAGRAAIQPAGPRNSTWATPFSPSPVTAILDPTAAVCLPAQPSMQ
jgi:hypothetical protein